MRWLAPGCALAVLFAAQPVLACTVCPLGSGRNTMAYYVTGILISVTQLLCVGGLAFWFVKRQKQIGK